MKYDIFISYSRRDTALVNEFYDRLVALGYSVWIDKDGIESGDAFKKVIVNAIKESRLLVFFSSASSNASTWTAKEIGVAVMEGVPIVPVKLDKSTYNDDVYFDLVNLDFTDYSSVRERNMQMERFLKSVQNKIPLSAEKSEEPVRKPSVKPEAPKKGQEPIQYLDLNEFEHLNGKKIGTVARKVVYSVLYLFVLFMVESLLFSVIFKTSETGNQAGGLIVLFLFLFGGLGVYFIWKPQIFQKKWHRECRDIEQTSEKYRIARGWNDKYGLCLVKGSWIRMVLGFDYPSVERISSFLFCLQDENGKFALYHVKRKMLTGFEFDRYSVDGDIVSLEKDGRIVYYSTQGFRQNF
jgi:hypothetical protein